uniref:transposase n=1 Tax=Caldicoprobacter guelmensis TaxID=1170224 RepID=UPI00374227E2
MKKEAWESTRSAVYNINYHVHVFLSAPPKITPAVIVKILKGSTACILFLKHPKLKKKL